MRVQCVAECSPGGGGAGRSAGGALVCVLLCLIVVLRGVFYCGVDGGALRCLAVWSAVVLGLREFLVMCCAPVMCGVGVCVCARARSRRVAHEQYSARLSCSALLWFIISQAWALLEPFFLSKPTGSRWRGN